jgi:hypothetical protein
MNDQHALVVEREQNVFAAPTYRFDSGSAKFGRELSRRQIGRGSLKKQLCLNNSTSHDEFLERAYGEFYFWKFRHGVVAFSTNLQISLENKRAEPAKQPARLFPQ